MVMFLKIINFVVTLFKIHLFKLLQKTTVFNKKGSVIYTRTEMSLSKTFSLFIFSLVTILMHSQVSANFGAAKFAPSDGKKLLILGQDLGAVGGLNSYNNGYVDSFTSHIPAGVTSYTNLLNLNGLIHLDNWGAGDIHAEAYFNDTTFKNSFIVIGLHLVGVLETINNGGVDNNIRSLAAWAKEKNRPVFIRIGYEFDGPWNNYDPTQYKKAWRHIVHIFDTENVKNVAYIWQSSGLNNNNIMDWYPGNDYVNWVGYSYFDGVNMGQSIRDFGEQHNKPIMIAEATPKVDLKVENPETIWTNWFEPLFSQIYSSNRVKALAYINVNWDNQIMWNGKGWGDSRLQEAPYVKEKWDLEVNKSPWITANDDILDTLNYLNWTTLGNTTGENLKKITLVITKANGELLIKSNTEKIIDKIYILDFLGRALYKNLNPQIQYNIKADLLSQQPFIVVVKLKNKTYVQKFIIR